MIDINKIPSPCYVMEEKLLRNNLSLIKSVKERAGVNIILAFKALLYGKRSRSYVSTFLFRQQVLNLRPSWPSRKWEVRRIPIPRLIRRLFPVDLEIQ